MTYEQLIEFAKQSGSDFTRSDHFVCTLHDFKRFADLVVAHEREACADLLEHGCLDDDKHHIQYAAAIRARGDA